jgi:hypothetical protein
MIFRVRAASVTLMPSATSRRSVASSTGPTGAADVLLARQHPALLLAALGGRDALGLPFGA